MTLLCHSLAFLISLTPIWVLHFILITTLKSACKSKSPSETRQIMEKEETDRREGKGRRCSLGEGVN